MRRAQLAFVLAVAAAVSACAGPRAVPAKQPAAAAAPAPGAWADGAVFYEVFVRSFQDSNGDGKGDLPGLIARLDYLNDGDPATTTDLGVDALWLMPVFASPSYHGYDVTDYETIARDYGTNADFQRLLDEAHRRGMKVVVDLVLNHTSSEHPWFIESASSPSSPRRDWYVWSATNPGWGQPWNPGGESWHALRGAYYYGLFWSGMPDLNWRNPAVREEARRIAALWLSRGVDGFRLDATRHLVETGPGAGQSDAPETHAFLKEFAAHVRAVKPDAVLIGENWTETPIIATYYGAPRPGGGVDELPLNFDFPLARAIVEGVQAGDAARIAEKLAEIRAAYPKGAIDVPFLTNHDMRRVASELADEGKLRSAAAVLLTLPGTPFLYYGEELGLANGPGSADEAKRTPMPWDASPGAGFSSAEPWYPLAPGRETANVAAQAGQPTSLLSHYRALIRARHTSPALARGELQPLASDGPLLAFLRTGAQERVLVVHNLGAAPLQTSLAVPFRHAEPLFATPGLSVSSAGSGAAVTLPPHASGVFRLE